MDKAEICEKLQTPGIGLAEGMELLRGMKRAELIRMANELNIDVLKGESNCDVKHNIAWFGFILPRQLKLVREMSRTAWRRNR